MGYTGALGLFRVRLDFDVSGFDLLLGCFEFLGFWDLDFDPLYSPF